MKFRHELSYDAPPATVFEMLADPEFRRAACEAQGVISVDVSLERDGEGFTLVVDQVLTTAGLPSFARTFAGETTQAIQREVWQDATGGSLVIEAPGKPTRVAGVIRLEPSSSGTREVVELDIKIKVPLLGGKLEKLMAEKMAQGMEVENAVGRDYLSR